MSILLHGQGGYEISQDIVLPYARLYLLGLSAFCVGFIYFIIRKTRFGMLIRATMQNRDMAKSLVSEREILTVLLLPWVLELQGLQVTVGRLSVVLLRIWGRLILS